MRHTPDTARPVARRGLCAVVLLALLALLHATFSPGTTHLSGLDLDGCLRRSVTQATAQACGMAPAAVLTGVGAAGHQDGDASQSCEASSYGPRQLADHGNPIAVSGDPLGGEPRVSAGSALPQGAPSPAGGTAPERLVLRC
ncbi:MULTISPECIES: hypothetical protein [unclassified Streptomyces]|uniref:hypothetical protein n=1 Tax=unclassified Streptomyces TaxID=2593676 RepID=UPI0033A98D5A